MLGTLARCSRARARPYLLADVAKAHDADDLARQLTAFVLLAVPLTTLHTPANSTADNGTGFANRVLTEGSKKWSGLATPGLRLPPPSTHHHATHLHGKARLGDVPRQTQDVRHRELGSGSGVAAGRVHHDDALAGGGGQVDVVHARPCTADVLQLRRRCQDVGCDLRAAVS